MRVISQGGKIDVPYKIATIFKIGNTILARNDRTEFELAEYSTEAKAIKAMEMLREAFFENKHEETYRDGIYYYSPCFQFPQNNEIEV